MALVAAASASLPLAAPSQAQTPAAGGYPSKPVRLVWPFSAGGDVDGVLRAMAQVSQQSTGQSYIVENKTGGAGVIAMQATLAAPADGYTLLAAPVGVMAVAPQVRKSPVDPLSAFTPVCRFAETSGYVFVGNHIKATTIQELIAYAKANPGKLSYGSGGIGTQIHLTGEMFQQAMGIKLLHVPYKGAADSLSDMLAGRLDIMFDPTLIPYAKSGKVRVLAYLARKPSEDFPNVPDGAQIGLPPMPLAWFGLFAPKGTPQPVIERAAQECEKSLQGKEMAERMKTFSIWPAYAGPKSFAEIYRHDYKSFGDIIRSANITLE
jgi:tripartite-type tricarboxylate transporter receptor subunit TctC